MRYLFAVLSLLFAFALPAFAQDSVPEIMTPTVNDFHYSPSVTVTPFTPRFFYYEDDQSDPGDNRFLLLRTETQSTVSWYDGCEWRDFELKNGYSWVTGYDDTTMTAVEEVAYSDGHRITITWDYYGKITAILIEPVEHQPSDPPFRGDQDVVSVTAFR